MMPITLLNVLSQKEIVSQKQLGGENVLLLHLYEETRKVAGEMGPVAAKYDYYDSCVKYGVVHVAAVCVDSFEAKGQLRYEVLVKELTYH